MSETLVVIEMGNVLLQTNYYVKSNQRVNQKKGDPNMLYISSCMNEIDKRNQIN